VPFATIEASVCPLEDRGTRYGKVRGIALHFDGASTTLYKSEQAALTIDAIEPGRQGVNSPGLPD
jgi:hypothetical protein